MPARIEELESLIGKIHEAMADPSYYKQDSKEIAAKYGISNIPTMLVFKGGEVVERLQGVMPKDQIQAAINNHKAA